MTKRVDIASRFTVASALLAVTSVIVASCGRHDSQPQGSSSPRPADTTSPSAVAAASDDYIPSITIDGNPVSFPLGTHTVWAAGARPSMSCDRRPGGEVDFRWAGLTPGSDEFSTSSVRAKMIPSPERHQLVLADVTIMIDRTLNPAPTGDPGRGHYWSHSGLGIRNDEVTATPNGFRVRADVRWEEDSSPSSTPKPWHAITMALVCHP